MLIHVYFIIYMSICTYVNMHTYTRFWLERVNANESNEVEKKRGRHLSKSFLIGVHNEDRIQRAQTWRAWNFSAEVFAIFRPKAKGCLWETWRGVCCDLTYLNGFRAISPRSARLSGRPSSKIQRRDPREKSPWRYRHFLKALNYVYSYS